MTSTHPALQRLLDLVCESRPDIDRGELEQVLSGALAEGWRWEPVLMQACGMVARHEELRDLRNALQYPPQGRGAARDGPVRPSRGP
jgi:hypothetical protein